MMKFFIIPFYFKDVKLSIYTKNKFDKILEHDKTYDRNLCIDTSRSDWKKQKNMKKTSLFHLLLTVMMKFIYMICKFMIFLRLIKKYVAKIICYSHNKQKKTLQLNSF